MLGIKIKLILSAAGPVTRSRDLTLEDVKIKWSDNVVYFLAIFCRAEEVKL
jgi:hypothetical protein